MAPLKLNSMYIYIYLYRFIRIQVNLFISIYVNFNNLDGRGHSVWIPDTFGTSTIHVSTIWFISMARIKAHNRNLAFVLCVFFFKIERDKYLASNMASIFSEVDLINCHISFANVIRLILFFCFFEQSFHDSPCNNTKNLSFNQERPFSIKICRS